MLLVWRARQAPVQKAIEALEFPKPIPIIFITIDQKETKDIIAFDTQWEELMPCSGTITWCAENQYLLYNNTRYVNGDFDRSHGFPYLLLLDIHCTDARLLKDQEVIFELIEQLYQFSRMYWKAKWLQNLPVTDRYPEMAAEMLPYFKNGNLKVYESYGVQRSFQVI